MAKRRTIIIAGAGIAGLTLALLLANAKFRVTVLEKSPSIDNAGVGIQLSPNATHVLATIGLSRTLAAVGFAPENISIKNGRSGRELSRYRLGKSISSRHGAPYLVLHRADLANLLLVACNEHPDISVVFGASFEDAAMHDNGVTVMALKSGQMVEFAGSALIGADGVRSVVRDRIIGAPLAMPSGDIAWRALVAVDKLSAEFDLSNTQLWMGRRGHVVCYPVRGMRMLNIVAITPEAHFESQNGNSPEVSPDRLREFFSHWSNNVNALLGLADSWRGWPLHEINPKARWTNNLTTLIGDAAHAMLPYAAQGGAAAIEDAAVLAASLANNRSDIAAGLQAYENSRRPRINKIWRLARKNRELYHMAGVSAFFRNMVLRNYSQKRLQHRLDWLYGWKPEATSKSANR